ncbi:uncharacterized protein LOC144343218 [Saccoglossus kowalevskii]
MQLEADRKRQQAEFEENEAQRKHELEMKQLELKSALSRNPDSRKLTSPCDYPCVKSQMPGGQEINSDVQCYKCKGYGHMSRECKVRPSQGYGVRCYNCGRLGHRSVTCRFSTRFGDRPNVKKVGAAVVDLGGDAEQESEISAVCLVQPKFTTKADIESCIDGGELLLAGGKRIPLFHNACFQQSVKSKRIGEKVVTTLRDTGCSGVVVIRDFVSDNQYTGKFCCVLMIDNTARTVPIAKLYVDTPYFTGEVEAQCLPDAIYDLVIGNVEGARAPDDPQWQEICAVVTRAMTKKGNKIVPLCVPGGGKSLDVNKAQLVKLQHDDPSLSKYWSLKEAKFKGNQEVMFLEKGGILYRQFTHPRVNQGRSVKQMVVPMPLRTQVMMVAHDSVTGGHMGVKKTSDRVLSNFYWPGIPRDITRFCRSCDICQRTVPKDYATRYPEAIPLKHISTEDVAEALVDIEVPQESTGFAPFELMYGRTIRGPMYILKQLWTTETEEPEIRNSYQYVFELREHLDETLKIAQVELQKSQQQYKHDYDKKVKFRRFLPGQMIVILLPTDSNKLLMQWKEPYETDSVIDVNDYRYEDSLDEDAVQDDDLLVLNSCMSKESVADMKYGRNPTHDQEQSVSCLVQIFTDLPGTTNLIQHCIQLKTNEPSSKPYPVPYSVTASLKEDIQSMLKMGVIRYTESPYASLVVIVRKKDGSNRIAPVAVEDIHKTAFVTPDGTYEFLKMPFGMMNSSATLVRGVRKMLSGMCKVVSYVDDILVHTIICCEHLTALKELFTRMADRPSKCIIASDVIDFVGHRVGQGFLSPHEDNVKKVRNVPRPATKKEIRSFLGLTGFYTEHIPNYAAIAVPLTDLTKNGQPIKVVWEEAHEKAYRTLIHVITSKPILRFHDSHKPYRLRTDASDVGIAAVLLQGHDGKFFPVSYEKAYRKGMLGDRLVCKEVYDVFVWNPVHSPDRPSAFIVC